MCLHVHVFINTLVVWSYWVSCSLYNRMSMSNCTTLGPQPSNSLLPQLLPVVLINAAFLKRALTAFYLQALPRNRLSSIFYQLLNQKSEKLLQNQQKSGKLLPNWTRPHQGDLHSLQFPLLQSLPGKFQSWRHLVNLHQSQWKLRKSSRKLSSWNNLT